MKEIKGKYNSAKIFNDNVESNALKQIETFLNHPAFQGSKIRIMPDVHAGMGVVIGFTAELTDNVIPNVVGVDIGCGVISFNLGHTNINYEKLDEFIYKNIPSGFKKRRSIYDDTGEIIHNLFNTNEIKYNINDFFSSIKSINKEMGLIKHDVSYAIGSLGGGNHFIEVGLDENKDYWLTIHSGSRYFGKVIADYYQKKANEYCKRNNLSPSHSLAYLPLDKGGNEYLEAMSLAQSYAVINRRAMAKQIIEKFFDMDFWKVKYIESIHNYIDFKDNIIRKGAISAYEGEDVVIPLNMRDGTIIGKGKSNEDWNFSAPHGAGRVMGRKDAKRRLNLSDFKKSMVGIWSSSVCKATIDEAPMVYKKKRDVIKYIKESVKIELMMKSVYNFKAT